MMGREDAGAEVEEEGKEDDKEDEEDTDARCTPYSGASSAVACPHSKHASFPHHRSSRR